MRRIAFAAAILMHSAAAMAQGAFEGVLTLSTSNMELKEEAQVSLYLKNGRSRMDFSAVTDGHASAYSLISDERGTDMVAQGVVTPIPASALRSPKAMMQLLDEQPAEAMGQACVLRTYTDGHSDWLYWLASNLPVRLSDLPMVLRRNMPQMEAGLFPVRMEKRSPDGTVLLSQELKQISPSTVDGLKFKRD